MKEILGWVVATVILGLIFYVVDTYIPKEGKFALLFRIMAGVIAVVLFIGFILSVVKYFGIPMPW